jgi:hypothetical protein
MPHARILLTFALLTAAMLSTRPAVAGVEDDPARKVDATAAETATGATAATDNNSQRVERVTFRRDGRAETLSGRVVSDAADGGVLLETDDGTLWPVEGSEVLSREHSATSFVPLSQNKMAERLLAELPGGFRIHTTPHYVVCYNTSRTYAQWTSSLLERLHRAFTGYWQRKGLKLREPEFPLVVLVFADRETYDKASRNDLPGGTGGIVAYYSLRSNRIMMYDLTGGSVGATGRRGSLKEINDMLSQPAGVPLVTTIVHEATHQIAFNCGLQQRYADIPLWLCEGMAVYFEAPDLASTRGWSGIGKVNYSRLDTFRENLVNWRDGSLKKLLADDRLLRDPHTAVDAYAAAWALCYYLVKYHPDQYVAYLKMLSEKRPLLQDGPQTRLDEFRRYFGDPDALERDFLKQLDRVK